jgi:hypothetical protein
VAAAAVLYSETVKRMIAFWKKRHAQAPLSDAAHAIPECPALQRAVAKAFAAVVESESRCARPRLTLFDRL